MTTSFWIEKGWGDHVENATMSDVLIAITETINMDDEHGAFWMGHNENVNVLEVHKDLTAFYIFGTTPNEQVKTSLASWEEAENLFQTFLEEDYASVKNTIEKKMAK